MASPFDNHIEGATRGHATQSANKRKRDAAAWTWIFVFQVQQLERRLTLRDYAELLTGHHETQTRSGKPWSEMQVKRVFDAHKSSPKDLYRRMTTPTPFERQTWSQDVYQAWRVASESLSSLDERNGRWVSALIHEPLRGDAVRFVGGSVPGCDEQAQYISSHGGKIRLMMLDLEHGTFEHEYPAAVLEVFVWTKSREQRIAESDRLHAQFFRDDNSWMQPPKP